MALIFVPKIVAIIQHRQNLGTGLNNAFHETMSTKEEEERFVKLNTENEELKLKISEKEKQIEEVKKKIEQLTKEQMERKRNKEKENKDKDIQVKTILKKAVRIQEPKPEPQHSNASTGELENNSATDSSTTSGKVSKPQENDFTESYL